ncbi:MAG: tRNA lysidine(34) synthetase TilS [Aestuariivirgaceae bacterium]
MPAASRNNEPITVAESASLLALLLAFESVALAVSGGSDSVAMMTLVAEWARSHPAAPRLAVLTVDHGLRPESSVEAQRVVAWAAALGLDGHCLRWDGGKPPSGLQAAARDARYRLMRQWCVRHGFGPIVTAHTLDDQAETLVMRLARGSGVEGLGAMPAESREPWHVLRPFLTVPRARLRATLAARGLPFMEDPSNRNRTFERVRTRELLAMLAEAGLSGSHIALAAARLRRANEALEHQLREAEQALLAVAPEGSASLDRDGLMALPAEIRIRLLGRAIARFGGRQSAPRLASLEALERWVAASEGIARTLGGCRVVRRKARFLLGREPGRMSAEPVTLEPGRVTVWDRRFAIALTEAGRAQSFCIRPVGGLRPAPARPTSMPDFVWRSTPAILANDEPVWLFGGRAEGLSVEFITD